MNIRWEPGRVKKTRWWEYGVRFGFGGLITALAGLIAREWGPVIGGLFLAFPAILPATATLLERDEGRRAAGVDAAGAVLGSIGLLAFAGLVWGLAGHGSVGWVLPAAGAAWLVLSAGLWWGREWAKRRARKGMRDEGHVR